MKRLIVLMTLLCTLALAGQAAAYSITLTPTENTTFVSLSVDIVGSPLMSGYNMDVTYDLSSLLFTGATFGTNWDPLASSAVDLGGDVFLLALVNTPVPDALSGSFNLATLNFDKLTFTTMPAFGFYDLTLTTPLGTVVPEPGTFLLLGLGLAGLVGYRRKFQKA